ncbi:PTS system mannose/fructose/sorbose family transporter subunit IID [Atopobacter sp. AH10]|uniref:PTS system mannose/fructose/sorbose family transporter subunit IID n=1 Tax=Atopobacter sp. AH10 TaxID=2315861 RepID=UPI000EF1D5C8|nr:PTS system mannose/fructose/sorbose family transporter subunit IID [Atopobacter sp. AH10]RLK63414.1 PTS system mannose/fructose/sorbose family transporter subunit IID [Atopobacter sp. AH10]
MMFQAKLDDNKKPLTAKERVKMFWQYQLHYAYSINFENWHGDGYSFCMKPLLKKYYDKEGQKEGMLRHLDFHNNEQTTASVVWGIITGMEEQRALGKPVDDQMIRTTKSALMGPVAGIGDSLIQATIVPLLTTIAISLTGKDYSPLGSVLYIIATPIILWTYAYFLYNKGYFLGRNAIMMLSGKTLDKIRNTIQVFGVVVIGALSASYVKLQTILKFGGNNRGAKPIVLQDILNNIFPNILSLLLVLGCYYLVSKKNYSIAKLIGLLMAMVLVLSLVGII